MTSTWCNRPHGRSIRLLAVNPKPPPVRRWRIHIEDSAPILAGANRVTVQHTDFARTRGLFIGVQQGNQGSGKYLAGLRAVDIDTRASPGIIAIDRLKEVLGGCCILRGEWGSGQNNQQASGKQDGQLGARTHRTPSEIDGKNCDRFYAREEFGNPIIAIQGQLRCLGRLQMDARADGGRIGQVRPPAGRSRDRIRGRAPHSA